MTTDDGQPKEMDSFLALAEERGLWHPVNHPEIQAWSQRVLALSMQKLVDVLVRSRSLSLILVSSADKFSFVATACHPR